MKNNGISIAIEAPVDVTEKTTEEMDKINAEYESVETDVMTDDLDGDESNETEMEDTTDDQETEDAETDDSMVEEETEDVSEPSPDELEKEYHKKVRIHTNTIAFLDVVRNSYDSFNGKYSKNCNPERLKDFHTINKAFTDLIESTEKTLKEKFTNAEYTDMVKYYVSYNRIYDIIVRMVENFVIDKSKVN